MSILTAKKLSAPSCYSWPTGSRVKSVSGMVSLHITTCKETCAIGSLLSPAPLWCGHTRSSSGRKTHLSLRLRNKTLNRRLLSPHWPADKNLGFWMNTIYTRPSCTYPTTSRSRCSFWTKKMKWALCKTILRSFNKCTTPLSRESSVTLCRSTQQLVRLRLKKLNGLKGSSPFQSTIMCSKT